ncbi:Golgin candidate 5 [Vitis vinifera]|uniref:Golgin candidate 5 n=1 Tax=Vitis vinifera TaxID=29760 RepID=A0A438E0P5_VITVI|nr:Golgin candidate 5 [Vitis vinifera]
MVQNQFNSKIQVLKSDNAKEYFTSSLSTYLQNHGIIHISSCVDTPQQNGVAERKNRHLLEVARCLMFSSNVPNYFWGEAILTATYLINRMPSRVLTFQSPRQLFLKQFPHTYAASSDLPLKVFGCTAFVHVYPQNRSKFAPRANKCIFLGYSPTQKGYKCYSPTNKRFYTTMDVSFFEHVFFYPKSHVQGESMNEHQVWESFLEGVPSFHSESPNPSQFAPTELSTPMPPSVQPAQHTNEEEKTGIRARITVNMWQYIDSNSSLPEENIGEDRAEEVLIPSIDDSTLPIALRKGVRRCTDHPIGNYVTYEGLSPSYRAFATSLDDTQVPNTIQEALKISEWKKAVQDEIDALEKNGTWTITDLPVGKRPVGCKWIFTIKYKADGSVERFKARLVARGFTQSYGIDYQETFAPVAKLNTIRILLSLAVNQDWCLQQLDIKNAFLNGDLEEEVYMEIPPGFEESMAKNQVCKLQKSLYGLKQSPRAWFDRFTKAVLKLGYKQGQADHTLFVKKSHAGKLAILIVYVDDIILSGNDMGELQNLKKYLSEEFEVKDLGNLKYFLGMEVARSRKGIVVSQRKYILDLLKETGMLGCKPIDTPMDSQKKLGIEKESTTGRQGEISAACRALDLSLTHSTRYWFCSECWKGLFFRKTENRDTEVYSDADWAGNIIDRRSTSGYCSFVWGNLVTWRSKKQSVVARSSAEAEYRALAQGICEGIWIKRVLSELGQTSSSPILIMCDNQAAISIAKNPCIMTGPSMLRLTDTLSQRRYHRDIDFLDIVNYPESIYSLKSYPTCGKWVNVFRMLGVAKFLLVGMPLFHKKSPGLGVESLSFLFQWYVFWLNDFQVEENKVESIKRDKAATEKLLQETIEKHQAELAAQKEYYTNALTAAKEAEALAEARANSEARTELEIRLREAEEREAMLVQALEELRQTLSRTEQQAVFREDRFRRDIEDLQKRYQASERRCEELITQVPESTRPLLRQIEAMQETTARRAEAWAAVERSLNSRLQEAEAKAATAEEKERSVNERLSQTLSRVNVLEAQLEEEIRELRKKHKQELQDALAHRESCSRTARLQSSAVSNQTPNKKQSSGFENGNLTRKLSSASSVGSMEESYFLQASLDPSDSLSERRNLGEATMSPYYMKSMTPSAFEAAIRQKEGELASYMSRLASMEAIRDSLAEELVQMTEQCEKLRAEAAFLPGIRAELEALRRRHSSALELMGERDEEVHIFPL